MCSAPIGGRQFDHCCVGAEGAPERWPDDEVA
jgi:hypothetical protein